MVRNMFQHKRVSRISVLVLVQCAQKWRRVNQRGVRVSRTHTKSNQETQAADCRHLLQRVSNVQVSATGPCRRFKPKLSAAHASKLHAGQITRVFKLLLGKSLFRFNCVRQKMYVDEFFCAVMFKSTPGLPTTKFESRLKAFLANASALVETKESKSVEPAISVTDSTASGRVDGKLEKQFGKESRQPVVLLLSGSFNPVHAQHLAIFDAARGHLEKKCNKVVLGAYMAPSSDSYVRSKLGADAISLLHRVELCRLQTVHSNYVEVCDWGLASGGKTTQEIERQLKIKFGVSCADLKAFEICGADFALRAHKWRTHGRSNRSQSIVVLARTGSTQALLSEIRDTPLSERNKNFILVEQEGPDVSSTQVRTKLNSANEKEWRSLVTEKLLSQNVLDYLVQHWNNLGVFSRSGVESAGKPTRRQDVSKVT